MKISFTHWILLFVMLFIAGCQSSAFVKTGKPSGGFYAGDRPPATIPANIQNIPDASPQVLPLSKSGNKPYQVLGKNYKPLSNSQGYKARGIASWYGKKFHGRRTSSGEPYDMFAMTAAHTILPLPSFVRVTNLENRRSVIVKVNDRGPFLHGRIIDLSYAAATKLGITAQGTGRVEVVAIDPTEAVVTKGSTFSTTITDDNLVRTADSGQYLLQLGSFASLNNALKLRNKLVNAGYSVVPVSADQFLKSGSPYVVLAGPITGQVDAQKVKSILEQILRQPVLVKPI